MKFWPFSQAKKAISPGDGSPEQLQTAASCLETSTALSRGELIVLYPLTQGKKKACLPCLNERLEKCYSHGPGAILVFILGSLQVGYAGATFFPFLVMEGSA